MGGKSPLQIKQLMVYLQYNSYLHKFKYMEAWSTD